MESSILLVGENVPRSHIATNIVLQNDHAKKGPKQLASVSPNIAMSLAIFARFTNLLVGMSAG